MIGRAFPLILRIVQVAASAGAIAAVDRIGVLWDKLRRKKRKTKGGDHG